MNKFYLNVLFVLFTHFAYSAPVIKSVKDGYSNQASTRNLNCLPQVADTMAIVAANTVTVNNDISFNRASFFKIYEQIPGF